MATFRDLLSAAKASRYEAFVIDWLVGETSSAGLIHHGGARTHDRARERCGEP